MGCTVKIKTHNILDHIAKDEREYKDMIDKGIKQNFEKQSNPEGQRWKPWKPRTITARERRYGHYAQHPIRTDAKNIWTGVMMEGTEINVTRTSNHELEFHLLNTISYARYANKLREFMGLNTEEKEKLINKIVSY